MLDKKRKVLRPVNLNPLLAEEHYTHSAEQELLSHLLDFSRQEFNESLLNTNLLFLLNKHPVLKNKKIALWHVDNKNNVYFIASQQVNETMKRHFSVTIQYEPNNRRFLQILNSTNSINSGFVQTDIYLERTLDSLLGVSIWFETEELSSKLHSPFFKDLFTLLNLIVVKTFYNDTLNKDIKRQKKDYEAFVDRVKNPLINGAGR